MQSLYIIEIKSIQIVFFFMLLPLYCIGNKILFFIVFKPFKPEVFMRVRQYSRVVGGLLAIEHETLCVYCI